MIKILLPTNYIESSLNQLDSFIQNIEVEGFECLLIFSDFIDDSIADLLFYSRTMFLKEKMPETLKLSLRKSS